MCDIPKVRLVTTDVPQISLSRLVCMAKAARILEKEALFNRNTVFYIHHLRHWWHLSPRFAKLLSSGDVLLIIEYCEY